MFAQTNKSESTHGVATKHAPETDLDRSDLVKAPTILFRRSSCSCGGGCPSCRSASSGLRVSQPNDAAEIEADQIADQAMRRTVEKNKPIATRSSFQSNVIHRQPTPAAPIAQETPDPITEGISTVADNLSENNPAFSRVTDSLADRFLSLPAPISVGIPTFLGANYAFLWAMAMVNPTMRRHLNDFNLGTIPGIIPQFPIKTFTYRILDDEQTRFEFDLGLDASGLLEMLNERAFNTHISTLSFETSGRLNTQSQSPVGLSSLNVNLGLFDDGVVLSGGFRQGVSPYPLFERNALTGETSRIMQQVPAVPDLFPGQQDVRFMLQVDFVKLYNHFHPDRTPIRSVPQQVEGDRVEGGIQRKSTGSSASESLRVSQPTDAAEIEADQIADRVMQMPVPSAEIPKANHASPTIQRKCDSCEEGEDEEFNDEAAIQRKPLSVASGLPTQTPRHISSVITSGGQTLDHQTRNFFEPRFGADLSRVRVHTDGAAASSANEVDARAYTLGNDIVFGSGEYAPETSGGKQLLAHELAHVVQQSSDGSTLHRCPRGQSLDTRYNLCVSSGGTTFEPSTGDYGLSDWDREHLRRWHGFYFIEGSETSLITPPEVRRAAGLRAHSVLIPLSAQDLQQFPNDPEGTVRRLVAAALPGVTVRRMTHSREPDRRFATSAIPREVEDALTVGSADAEAARERAASTTQLHTLTDAARRSETLPMQPLTMADLMGPGDVTGMTASGRADWYVEKLGALQTQLHESAQRHHIPMQLLAVVILNELADINIVDVAQSGSRGFGSLGIAQIQVSTARRDRLVDTTSGRSIPDLLQVPQVAVEAAAAEIEMLLARMSAHRSRPFQQQHGFTGRHGAEGDAIYSHIGGETRQIREANLARMVCAAYNSPDIVVTTHPGSGYRNAVIHGNNARLRAFDLYEFGLFRDAAPRTERRDRTASLAVQPVASMRFDGSTLTVVAGDGTEAHYTALSGLRPSNPHNRDGRDHTGPGSQGIADVGPIPEGSYSLVPTEIERAGFSATAWGPIRARLHESTMTGLRRRAFTSREGGFFLHQDVGHDGTAGCIGLQDTAATRELFGRIARTPGTIEITVEHTHPPTPMPARPRPRPTERRRRRDRH